MTTYSTRSTALLIVFIALIACANAQPDAPQGFDNMDWTWLSSVGTQFSDAIANGQLAHMTMSPMSGNIRDSASPRLHLRQQQSPQPARPSDVNDMEASSSWSMGMNEGFGIQYAAPNGHLSHSLAHSSNLAQEPAMNTQQDLQQCEPGQQWSQMADWNIDPSLRPNDDLLGPVPPATMLAPPPSNMHASSYPGALQPLSHNWSFQAQADPMDPAGVLPYDYAPQPPMRPSMIPRSCPESFQIQSVATAPSILPADVTSNYNYQEGMAQGTIENMRGWIGRAPTTGDRAVPRLDTNHLAPPEHRSANRSPTSASTTGSSTRPGSRRKPWEMQSTGGDFICGNCNAGFPTQGDLHHHLRSHAPYTSRKHICTTCDKRFQYHKDLLRHLPKHDPNRKKYYCPFSTCKYHAKGFGRTDHLERHLASQHRIDTPQRVASRSPSNTNMMRQM